MVFTATAAASSPSLSAAARRDSCATAMIDYEVAPRPCSHHASGLTKGHAEFAAS